MPSDRAEPPRRPAKWTVALSIAVTVVGLVGLVVTDPAGSQDVAQPRLWAIGTLLVGLMATLGSLMARARPEAPHPPRAPRGLAWLLLVAAGCGLLALIGTVRMGREDPWAYVSPVLLTVFPLAIYGYQSWRYRRWKQADADAAQG